MKKIVAFFLILFLWNIQTIKAIEVSTFEELKTAMTNEEAFIELTNNIDFNELLTINYDVEIQGNGHSLTRESGFKNSLFSITAGKSLTIKSMTIDSGASGWVMDLENRYYTQADNKGYVRIPTINDPQDILSTASLIVNKGTLNMDSVTLQNGRCTVSGCAINSNGSINSKDTIIQHFGSTKSGGAFYVNGGEVTLDHTSVIGNVGGAGVVTSVSAGGMYISGANKLEIINQSVFEDNISQGNGAAIYILKTSTYIKESVFRHNMAGNDGAALDMKSTVDGNTFAVEDTIFEKNIGFAKTGQSMGVIWLEQWNSTEENPILFRNTIFRENDLATGAAIADGGNNTNVLLENTELYDNDINSGGLAYAQAANYTIKGLQSHDNKGRGTSVYLNGTSISNMENAEIKNNIGTSSGIAVSVIAGTLHIKDSEISGNETTSARGGGIFIRGYYEGNNPVVTIENTIIKDNKAATVGGGICIADAENVFSNVTIDDQSQIYDNHATEAGDDFVYIRDNNSENTSTSSITLDNISIAGITGIDGWYNDNENDRFMDTDNPRVFEDYQNYTGYGIYLKAAGINTTDYELNGGENDSIVPVSIKYGQDYTIPDETPVKEGYEFVGWNTKEDGSGTPLNPGDIYDGSEGYSLYAQYQETEYTINYHLMGGEGEGIESQTLLYTQEFKVTETLPTKEGYIFKEWNTKEDGSGTPLNPGDTYDRSEGFDLYAIYEETEYTISYHLMGGEGEGIESQTHLYTEEFKVTEILPIKEGYIFKEWNTKEDGSGTPLNPGDIYDRSEGFDLYAIYEETSYTITYHFMGGEGDGIETITQLYTIDFIVSNTTPIKEGHEFVGWNTKEDGSGKLLNPGDTYDRSEGFDLYAIYKEERKEEEKEIIEPTENTGPKTKDNFYEILIAFIFYILGTIIGIKYYKTIKKN